MVTSLLKITWFTIISKSRRLFLNSSSIMRARRLQEVYCRFEIRRTVPAAKDERHLVGFFNDCSSLSVSETLS